MAIYGNKLGGVQVEFEFCLSVFGRFWSVRLSCKLEFNSDRFFQPIV